MATRRRTTTRRKTMRTRKGNVTSTARKKTGMKGQGKKGKFPVFDVKSATSAINLRHSGKGVTASAVLAKVARWARVNNKPAILKKVEAARKKDRKK